MSAGRRVGAFVTWMIATMICAGISTANVERVYECGGVEDTCPCGAANPYPCCWNDANCTWFAWHQACCIWGDALESP